MRPHRRVVVTGIGLATPLGVGTDLAWTNLLNGASGIRHLTVDDILEGEVGFEQMPIRVGACVPRLREGDAEQIGAFDVARWCEGDVGGVATWRRPGVPPLVGGGARIAPFAGLALAAAAEALEDAGWSSVDATSDQRRRAGVCIGAGMGHVGDLTNAGRLLENGRLRRVSPFFVPRILVNMAAGHVSMRHGLEGPNHAAATACATGAHAIGDAFRAVQRGDADLIVAGGTESCIDAVSIVGFTRARALADPAAMGLSDDPAATCRPFDASRGGFVMGEGAGVLVLEDLESARRRHARPYAEIRGYGQASDAHHITQPPASGAGAAAAMEAALTDAGVRPEEVTYVNAHATGTKAGDAAEAAALARVFGSRFSSGEIAVSSTKGATGHLLGAAGAVEAAFAALALASGVVPPTLNLVEPDVGLGAAFRGANFVPLVAQRAPGLRAALTNSFGFGGTNASLVLTLPPVG